MPPLGLSISRATPHTTVVEVSGELDCSTVDALLDCIRSIDPASTTVIVDAGALTFLDSMGIGAFAALHRELDRSARTLQIRNLVGQPYRVIEMTEMHRVLHLT